MTFKQNYLPLHFSPFYEGQQVCGHKRDEGLPHRAHLLHLAHAREYGK